MKSTVKEAELTFVKSPEKTPAHLKRSLKPRHLNMIAIGGSIGTGLFVASGSTVATAGPGGALLAYALIGLMVFFLMTSLGEMAAYIPDSGSFSTYGSRFIDEGFGFAMGWNYWYNWAVTIAAELVAAQLVMHFWFPDVPGLYWSAIFLAIMFGLNFFSVKGFGESEFWFALIKVVAVVIFIGIGLASIFGIMHGIDSPGFSNFTTGDAPFVGGLQAMVGVAMIAGFSFQGTELIGVAAGESEHPHKSIPIAIRQVFWRILMFYILSIFVIGMLIPYTDPNLLKTDSSDISTSPFTLLFERAGLAAAAGVMNAVILSAILSAGNSGMYASTRMLYTMALHGQAPRLFRQISQSGVPRYALYATTLVGGLCFLTSFIGDKTVYTWLLNTSGMCGFIVWLGIAISHYRFRKGYLLQGGKLEELPYRAKWFPFGPLFAFALCLAITLGQNYQAFVGETIDWTGLVATYVSLPLFLVIWWGYRLKNGSRFVRYEEMDVTSGRDVD
ncbi:gamma-aminobutyrate permease [Pseudomonas sp. AAC]|nr:gamma-aminobutyrate permease [Pseudomonas sp. AAC]